MINEEFKPIPKYMLKLIKEKDLKCYPIQDGHTRFYSYLTKYKKQLVRVTVAVRNYRTKWYCKQVVLHGVHSDKCYLKDIIYFYSAGYKVGWYDQGIGQYRKRYESHGWDYNDDKYFKINCPIINKEFALKFPEYKYSGIELYHYNDIFNYFRLYEKFPQVEYITKAGLQHLATSKLILNKCAKDKMFCKWLLKHKDEIKHPNYVNSVLIAYKENKPVELIDKFTKFKREFESDRNVCFEIKKIITLDERNKFINYVMKQNISFSLYKDYLEACLYLKLDMNLDKNKFPKDFNFWHDIRIDEYATAKALADKKKRQELYNQFSKVALKYQLMERNLKDNYCVLIANSPADLIREGELLNHCVGRMGYDQRFAKEQSLIFFVRNKNNPQQPFVTVEYSLNNHKILQCYAKNNTKPTEEVLTFIYKIWLPYANRKIRKIS